jgi:hypothetical protein
MRKLFSVILLLFFLTGCNNELVVHNAKRAQITPIFKEYVGIHGYRVSYENDTTGAYRVDMGTVTLPEKRTISKVAIGVPTSNFTYPLTSYEEESWEQTTQYSKDVALAVMVRIFEQGDDVILKFSSEQPFYQTGEQGTKFADYVRESGYQVDVR